MYMLTHLHAIKDTPILQYVCTIRYIAEMYERQLCDNVVQISGGQSFGFDCIVLVKSPLFQNQAERRKWPIISP